MMKSMASIRGCIDEHRHPIKLTLFGLNHQYSLGRFVDDQIVERCCHGKLETQSVDHSATRPGNSYLQAVLVVFHGDH